MASGGARVGAGRPRTPTALRILQGNPGKRPLPKGEPKPKLASLDPPVGLNERALVFWCEYAPKLLELGILTELDRPQFATACEQHALYERLMAVVFRYPFGKRAKEYSPRAYKALQERDRILSRFGFDPASRAKLNVEPSKSEDEFETLLRRHKP